MPEQDKQDVHEVGQLRYAAVDTFGPLAVALVVAVYFGLAVAAAVGTVVALLRLRHYVGA